MTGVYEIRNGRIVTPSSVIEGGRVVVAGDRIERVERDADRTLPSATTVDATDCVVMPGLVDLHGDDIEGHLRPRSGTSVDLRMALTTADRTNLFHGVTTKFHAVAFEDAPDDGRCLETAASIARELDEEGYTLADNRFHARCELTAEAVAAAEAVAEEVELDLLSIMYHAPGAGQYDRDGFERHYVEDRNWSVESVEEIAAEREAIDPSTRRARIDRVVELGRRHGVPVASHDDESPAEVDRMADRGAAISEYPLSMGAASRATELGLDTVMGAPNVVRGGSLCDNLDARAAIAEGVVDALCSDYHPPSLLAAPFVDTGEPLWKRVNRVTRNPAEMAGLRDRGRIEPGARADLLVVDPASTPTVCRALVGGEEALRAGRESTRTRDRITTAGS